MAKTIKLIGKLDLYEEYADNQPYLAPRFLVKIKTPNNIHNDITVQKMNFAGFNILNMNKRITQMLLPPNWYMFNPNLPENKDLLFVFDGENRCRAVIGNDDIKFIPKYHIKILHRVNNKVNEFRGIVHDNGIASMELYVPDELREDILINTKNDKNEMEKIYLEYFENAMNELIPDWEDELAYWDSDSGTEL